VADPTTLPIAQAHPTETWAALGVLAAGLVSLVGVLYSRINTDIKGVDTSVKDLSDDLYEEVGALKRDMNEIGTKLSAIGQQIAQFATSSTFTNEELDRIEADIKDLNKRLLTIEVEHKHCIGLHNNLLGGNNNHH